MQLMLIQALHNNQTMASLLTLPHRWEKDFAEVVEEALPGIWWDHFDEEDRQIALGREELKWGDVHIKACYPEMCRPLEDILKGIKL